MSPLFTVLAAVLLALPGQSPAAVANNSPDALAGTLRGILLSHVPTTLYEASPGWGHTVRIPVGIHWKGQGLNVRPEAKMGDRNDGDWRKVRVTTVNLPQTLVVEVRDVQTPEPGRTTFGVYVSFPALVDYEHQKWREGTRIYGVGARARLRLHMALTCESVFRIASTTFFPELVFRLRVVQARVAYDQFVMEHVAGIGGEAAKLLGDTIRKGIEQWHPSIERNLLAKAEAALVKAGDTREVRVGLNGLVKEKSRQAIKAPSPSR